MEKEELKKEKEKGVNTGRKDIQDAQTNPAGHNLQEMTVWLIFCTSSTTEA